MLPVDDVFPVGYSVEDSNVQSQIDMQNSQQEAIAAALTELGYDFEQSLKVAQTQEGAPADGVLEAGDIILSLERHRVCRRHRPARRHRRERHRQPATMQHRARRRAARGRAHAQP